MNKEDYLYKSFLTLKTEDEVRQYLRDLLTVSEIREFADRLWIAKMLDENCLYKQINVETKASSRTIARVNRWLKDGRNGYRLVLGRLKHSHQTSNHRL